MAKKKKQSSNVVGWVLIALLAFGIFQFGSGADPDHAAPATTRTSTAPAAARTPAAPLPLDAPRFVNVASLNVRHAPDLSAPLVTALPRYTPLRVLGRQDGWLLVDLNPTLEGWVSEHLTTTRKPRQSPVPPASLRATN